MDVRDDLVSPPQPRSGKTPRRLVAAVLAGLVGAGLMGGVGYTHGSDVVLGVVAGAVLVGILGHGVVVGSVSPAMLGGVLFGLAFAMIDGGGCVDPGGLMMIGAAVVGAVVGRVAFGPRVRGRS